MLDVEVEANETWRYKTRVKHVQGSAAGDYATLAASLVMPGITIPGNPARREECPQDILLFSTRPCRRRFCNAMPHRLIMNFHPDGFGSSSCHTKLTGQQCSKLDFSTLDLDFNKAVSIPQASLDRLVSHAR